jgi:carbon catabolite-derepressing protein kinase
LGGADNPYFPASPPTENVEVGKVTGAMSNLTTVEAGDASPLDPAMSSSRSVASSTTSAAARPYVSKIGILPSSLPAYHHDYMEREKAREEAEENARRAQEAAKGNSSVQVKLETSVDDTSAALPAENHRDPRTPAEQEEVARRLKPHSRGSQIRLDEAGKPQSLTPVNPPKKPKPVRWQFGIRSRNAPFEALLCIYKALSKLGASWMIDEDFDSVYGNEKDREG